MSDSIKTQIATHLTNYTSSAYRLLQIALNAKNPAAWAEITRRQLARRNSQSQTPQIFLSYKKEDIRVEVEYVPGAKPLEDEIEFSPQELETWIRENFLHGQKPFGLTVAAIFNAYIAFRRLFPDSKECWFAWSQQKGIGARGYPSQIAAASDSLRPEICSPQEAYEIIASNIVDNEGMLLKTQTVHQWKVGEKTTIAKLPHGGFEVVAGGDVAPGTDAKFRIPARALPMLLSDLKRASEAFIRLECFLLNIPPEIRQTFATLQLRHDENIMQWKWWITNQTNKEDASAAALENVSLLWKRGSTRTALCLTHQETLTLKTAIADFLEKSNAA